MKRIVNGIVIVLFSFFLYSSFAFAAIIGDINEDGIVDDYDLNMIVNYLINEEGMPTGLSDEEWERTWNYVTRNGDINKDGKIDIDDRSEIVSILIKGHTLSGVGEATSCVEFKDKDVCNAGNGKNGTKFGCAWNEKYEFCSPNGLIYLSCGSGDTNAHDVPVFLPAITSYGIVLLKTVTPVILIIMSMIQIVKSIASQNEDEIKKAQSALIKKLIAASMIFFITSIVQFIIKQVADSSEVGSVNQCLSCFVNNNCNGSMYYVDGYGHCYYISDSDNAVDCGTDIGIKQGHQQGGTTSNSSNNS